MSTAAHSGVIRGQGTSTAFTNEPTTRLTANTRYQIQTDARRLLDPAVAVTVQVDADGAGAGGYVTAAATSYSIDYMFGIITFAADQGSSALVRVSASYLPVVDIIGVTSWKIEASCTVLDDTTVNNTTGWRTKKTGLKDLSGSLELNESLLTDNDTGGGVLKFDTVFTGGTPLLFERSAAGNRFRAWVLLQGTTEGGSIDELVGNTVNYVGAARAVGAGFGWEA